ncbi:Dabb family protein [Bradyrhizobium sp. LMTR 3]|uniref:Dabb family protein n=1 Tax=Bradyrhizobium sp. LMTR 3 TaxID=189873 RepID=UPI000810DA5A|nr:Dabb family protein [Bradyrhizobium sp. LMTR 3]OCK54010.1 stress responsive protein [Bradyrhizobium sp. LMTR 3]
MIRHIVLFSAKDQAHIERIIEGLSVLTTIPHARRLEIARNCKTDQLGNEIDVVVYGEFDNEKELAAYKAHDLYQESIRRVRPLRELRFAADYNVSADARFASTAAISEVSERFGSTGGG